jgi:hypothetical protein
VLSSSSACGIAACVLLCSMSYMQHIAYRFLLVGLSLAVLEPGGALPGCHLEQGAAWHVAQSP